MWCIRIQDGIFLQQVNESTSHLSIDQGVTCYMYLGIVCDGQSFLHSKYPTRYYNTAQSTTCSTRRPSVLSVCMYRFECFLVVEPCFLRGDRSKSDYHKILFKSSQFECEFDLFISVHYANIYCSLQFQN